MLHISCLSSRLGFFGLELARWYNLSIFKMSHIFFSCIICVPYARMLYQISSEFSKNLAGISHSLGPTNTQNWWRCTLSCSKCFARWWFHPLLQDLVFCFSWKPQVPPFLYLSNLGCSAGWSTPSLAPFTDTHILTGHRESNYLPTSHLCSWRALLKWLADEMHTDMYFSFMCATLPTNSNF